LEGGNDDLAWVEKSPNFRSVTLGKTWVLCGFSTSWRNLDASHDHRSHCCRRL